MAVWNRSGNTFYWMGNVVPLIDPLEQERVMSDLTEYDELADLGDALKAEKDKVAALEAKLSKMEPWWNRMSNEDVAAELSATFDLNLDVTRQIADWILAGGNDERV